MLQQPYQMGLEREEFRCCLSLRLNQMLGWLLNKSEGSQKSTACTLGFKVHIQAQPVRHNLWPINVIFSV